MVLSGMGLPAPLPAGLAGQRGRGGPVGLGLPSGLGGPSVWVDRSLGRGVAALVGGEDVRAWLCR